MDNNQNPEPYTASEFGMAVVKITAISAAETAIAIALITAAGYSYSKLLEHRTKKATKK